MWGLWVESCSPMTASEQSASRYSHALRARGRGVHTPRRRREGEGHAACTPDDTRHTLAVTRHLEREKAACVLPDADLLADLTGVPPGSDIGGLSCYLK